MQEDAQSPPLTSRQIAAAFREFDALWEQPGSPERNARMEEILRRLGETDNAAGAATPA